MMIITIIIYLLYVELRKPLGCVPASGVGDLYTDPQIHTEDGQGYGDANLGTRGMALFFSSHKCNK